jgi:hypothetical protein
MMKQKIAAPQSTAVKTNCPLWNNNQLKKSTKESARTLKMKDPAKIFWEVVRRRSNTRKVESRSTSQDRMKVKTLIYWKKIINLFHLKVTTGEQSVMETKTTC